MGGGVQGVLSFIKSKVKVYVFDEELWIIFVDVVGVDEVKQEFIEIVDFFKCFEWYVEIGVCIFKGVLLVGFLGIGKILLFKVVVGEVEVFFFIIFGLEFVEFFVGVGVVCVCDLFEEVKKKVLCIIFIDEFDVIGKSCLGLMGVVGGNDEWEQIFNQLFIEMDGFIVQDKLVIVLVVINQFEVFDVVLLCLGCFDW